ncbi:MAG: hypothetical protein Q9M35_00515 [Rhodothermus sp.]|nr:hypothetical protein [Rhodothermus sp.]
MVLPGVYGEAHVLPGKIGHGSVEWVIWSPFLYAIAQNIRLFCEMKQFGTELESISAVCQVEASTPMQHAAYVVGYSSTNRLCSTEQGEDGIVNAGTSVLRRDRRKDIGNTTRDTSRPLS